MEAARLEAVPARIVMATDRTGACHGHVRGGAGRGDGRGGGVAATSSGAGGRNTHGRRHRLSLPVSRSDAVVTVVVMVAEPVCGCH